MLEMLMLTVVVLTGAAAVSCFNGRWCGLHDDSAGDEEEEMMTMADRREAAAPLGLADKEPLYVTLLRHADSDQMIPYNTFKLVDQIFYHREWYQDLDMESVAFAYSYLCFKRSCIATAERQTTISHIIQDDQYAYFLTRTFMLEGLSRAARHVYETEKLATMQDALVAIQYVCSFDRAWTTGMIHPYRSNEEIGSIFERSGRTRAWMFRMSKYSPFTENQDLVILSPNMTMVTLTKTDSSRFPPPAKGKLSLSHVRFVYVHGIGFYAMYNPVATAMTSFKNFLEARRHNSRRPLAVTFVDLVLYVCKKYLLSPDGYVVPPPSLAA